LVFTNDGLSQLELMAKALVLKVMVKGLAFKGSGSSHAKDDGAMFYDVFKSCYFPFDMPQDDVYKS
jgi:hypothetical protein